MKRQLILLEAPSEPWRLDDRTREIGRRGVARAREALREAERVAEARRQADTEGERQSAA